RVDEGTAIGRLTLTTRTPGEARRRPGKGSCDRLAVLDEMGGDTRRRQRAHDQEGRWLSPKRLWVDEYCCDLDPTLSHLAERGNPALVERRRDDDHVVVTPETTTLGRQKLRQRERPVGPHHGQALQHLNELAIRSIGGNRLQMGSGRDQTDVAPFLQEAAC